MALYAATIFLSAFLLFQVQPLIGKWILPWFGGTPAVWTTCMLFFQTALLAGYAYAHLLMTYLRPRTQTFVHLGVMAAAILTLPLAPSADWKPDDAGDPTWRILLLLAATAGLPYVALAATSPLLQAWFSQTHPGRSPYRLYALSNAGSLLALASYPFLFEPLMRLGTQGWAWTLGFAAFTALCGAAAVRAWRTSVAAAPVLDDRVACSRGCLREHEPEIAADHAHANGCVSMPPSEAASPENAAARPSLSTRLLWLALAACGSIMLLAVTNQMCSDVGVVPFLWVVPLGLYLATFIVCFGNERLYWRPVFWPLLVLAAAGIVLLLRGGVDVDIRWQVLGYNAALTVCCMVCHGELARLKPAPRHLTAYYLTSSAGGAVGGLFVTLAAPLLFTAYFELHIGVWMCFVLAAAAFWHEKPLRRWSGRWVAPAFGVGGVAVLTAVGVALVSDVHEQLSEAVSSSRNFYGVLQVVEYGTADDPESLYMALMHGRIMHGCQYPEEPLRRQATTYYSETSGVGRTLAERQNGPEPVRVGVVGLGTGSLAVYGRRGDLFRFYEINPAVKRLATSRFTYLADSDARCEVVLGDARLTMEREPPQQYDVLALDAFSSDATPVHLLTAEACDAYRRHLKPNGVLAIHISNRYLDLEPVVRGLAERAGFGVAVINDDTDFDASRGDLCESTWVLLTHDRDFLSRPLIAGAAKKPDAPKPDAPKSDAADAADAAAASPPPPPPVRLWTDDHSDLLGVLR